MHPILRQLEFYVSDANLLKDEFTRNLMKEHSCQIPLEIFNSSYKKLQLHKQTLDQVIEICKASKHLKINDNKCVVLNREPRNTPVTVIVKTTKNPFKFDNVISAFKKEGQWELGFYEQEEADECFAKYNNTEKDAEKQSDNKPKTYVKGLILKVTNLPTDTRRGDFTKIFEEFGEVKFVDFYDGNEFACVRFKESSPEATILAVNKFQQTSLQINNQEVVVTLVEGDEEKETWDKILNPKGGNGSKQNYKRNQKSGRKFK
ncbi:RNA binding motif-containing protein [Spironucleus salmonicida]|uniref:RNA binding motif-containing protein n=1 Tax=Spironucleus salmonicida TaxID=348837 RepID=V6LLT1_9EUKA|nr:RNA binding motif-containing protein [Spironucleus salmonicida]|eukprot:EST45637.1 RNA binding motif-containing protein [Spironucleus salmonicida]